MEEKLYYLGFSLFPGIGVVLFEKLVTHFGSAKTAWDATENEFKMIVGEKITERFSAFKKTIHLEKEYEKCVQKDISLITFEDKAYPDLVKRLGDVPVILSKSEGSKKYASPSAQNDNKESVRPRLSNKRMPFLLYVKGDVSLLSHPKTIGIVGTRKITQYGRQVTEMLTQDIVHAGFVTVSGLALGVDAIAHKVTVANGGKTIAVLGCGVDCCFPRENQPIYDQILATGGAIVSTFPPGMEATKGSFPARNALIAGLSQGIVVTEGAADSGSLITANYATKFGRPVFAVPGPITSSLSKGVNSLLKGGAVAVMSAADILDKLGIINAQKTQSNQKIRLSEMSDNPDEQSILKLLETGSLHFDEIVRKIGKDSKTIGSLLSLMELNGTIRSNGSLYTLNF